VRVPEFADFVAEILCFAVCGGGQTVGCLEQLPVDAG